MVALGVVYGFMMGAIVGGVLSFRWAVKRHSMGCLECSESCVECSESWDDDCRACREVGHPQPTYEVYRLSDQSLVHLIGMAALEICTRGGWVKLR